MFNCNGDVSINALNTSNWRAPTPLDYRQYLDLLCVKEGELRTTQPTHAMFSRELSHRFSPVEVYCYLKHRFGEPNGVTMMMGEPDSGNLYHWHYLIESGGSFLEIQSTQAGLSLWIRCQSSLGESDWQQFESHFRSELNSCSFDIDKQRRLLEDWIVFVNPYARLNAVVATLEEKVSLLELVPPTMPPLTISGGGWSKEDLEEFSNSANTYGKALVEAQQLGLSIRTTVPIWVESFINLLFFALAKPRVKNDKRLFESLGRQQIDVRIKTLSDFCDGFRQAVNDKDEPFLAIQKLFGRRNSILHGSVDLNALATDRMYFDGKRPVYREWMPDYLRRIPKTIAFIEPSIAAEDILIGSEFIIYLANLLERSVREGLWLIADTTLLGYRKDTKRVGVLFAEPIVFPVFSPVHPDSLATTSNPECE